jgi:hypothetical protein
MKLEHINNAARRQCLANLFHACICHIVEPLVEPGKDGMLIASGDVILSWPVTLEITLSNYW